MKAIYNSNKVDIYIKDHFSLLYTTTTQNTTEFDTKNQPLPKRSRKRSIVGRDISKKVQLEKRESTEAERVTCAQRFLLFFYIFFSSKLIELDTSIDQRVTRRRSLYLLLLSYYHHKLLLCLHRLRQPSIYLLFSSRLDPSPSPSPSPIV